MTGELVVGLVLGWLDGADEIDGFSEPGHGIERLEEHAFDHA